MPEVVLGFDYIDEKYRGAVVRVVVRKPNGDPAAGTGFFINDPPNHIVTNQHVAELEVIQIEDLDNNAFHHGDCPRISGPEDLDLAAIRRKRLAVERKGVRFQSSNKWSKLYSVVLVSRNEMGIAEAVGWLVARDCWLLRSQSWA